MLGDIRFREAMEMAKMGRIFIVCTLPSKLRGKRKVVGLARQLQVLLADILRLLSILPVRF